MDESLSLFLILGLVYAVECAVWIHWGAMAFSSWDSRRWRWRQTNPLAGNSRGGLLLANPCPPLGLIVYGQQSPISLSPDAVAAFNPGCPNGIRPIQTGRCFAFDQINSIRGQNKTVLLNDSPFLKASSEAHASFLVETIQRLRRMAPPRRPEAIRQFYADQLDVKAIQDRLDAILSCCRSLRYQANVLFGFVFLLAPWLIWELGLRRCWWALLALLLAQTILISIRFFSAHRRLMPDAPEERFAWFLTMLLAAPTAMRAHDLLARRAFERFHPLALARVLCPPMAFQSLARRILLDLHYPLASRGPDTPIPLSATVNWAREVWRETVHTFVSNSGLSMDCLLRPPMRSDPAHVSYCPRCEAQYVIDSGVCRDCGGLELKRFNT